MHPLGIPTIRDRVLQTILDAAVHPICEYQADPNSFGFRPKRSALQAISLIYGRLSQLGMQGGNINNEVPIKVCEATFKSFKGKKYRQRARLLTPNNRIRNRKYAYNY
jgi:hypothetical protein